MTQLLSIKLCAFSYVCLFYSHFLELALLHQWQVLLSFFTLLSFSNLLAWLMVMRSTELPLRGMGARLDVSWGVGLMVYWTLDVHFTEKNLEPGGALLKRRQAAHFRHVRAGPTWEGRFRLFHIIRGRHSHAFYTATRKVSDLHPLVPESTTLTTDPPDRKVTTSKSLCMCVC